MTTEEFLKTIPIGHRDPLPRPCNNEKKERQLRANSMKARLEARKIEDYVINVGNGYYRPDLTDPVDLKEALEYQRKNRSRVSKINEEIYNLDRLIRKKLRELKKE